MKKLSWVLSLAALVISCANQPTKQVNRTTSRSALRYLAWMEGEFQNDYQVDRKTVQTRLQGLQSNPPPPSDVESYLEYLSLLDSSGSLEADKKIRKFLEEHPTEKRAAFLLAVHYLRVRKKELATYFLSALERDPHFPWKSLLYNNLGLLALGEGNRITAMDYFERATKSSPPVAAPYVNLGAIYLQSRSYGDAEKLFSRAANLDDDFEDAVLGLGGALEGQGKYEEAHKIYSDFIATHPSTISVLYNDSLILGNRLKRREEAAEQMLRYVQRGGKESARAQEIIQSWR